MFTQVRRRLPGQPSLLSEHAVGGPEERGGFVEGFGRGGEGDAQVVGGCPVRGERGPGQHRKASGRGLGRERVAGRMGQVQPQPKAARWRDKAPGAVAAQARGEVVALGAQLTGALAEQMIELWEQLARDELFHGWRRADRAQRVQQQFTDEPSWSADPADPKSCPDALAQGPNGDRGTDARHRYRWLAQVYVSHGLVGDDR